MQHSSFLHNRVWTTIKRRSALSHQLIPHSSHSSHSRHCNLHSHIDKPTPSYSPPSLKTQNEQNNPQIDYPPKRKTVPLQKMLAKATCISLHTLALVFSIRPPASSTTKEKADKVKDEGLFSTIIIHIMPHLGQSAAAIATAVYILLMSRGYISGELKPWQVLTTVSGVLGYLLRLWSFKTLDHFFTVSASFVAREGERERSEI